MQSGNGILDVPFDRLRKVALRYVVQGPKCSAEGHADCHIQENSGVVRFRDPEANQEYVILPAEIYNRLRSILSDDGDWTPEEQLRLLAESGKRAGWDDPEMEVYDNYDENRKRLCP